MKKSEYPDRVSKAKAYTANEIAVLYGVAVRTACKLIDQGMFLGNYRLPGSASKAGERRVPHTAVVAHVRGNLGFSYVLKKIDGITQEDTARD